jgi:hypothetical protein
MAGSKGKSSHSCNQVRAQPGVGIELGDGRPPLGSFGLPGVNPRLHLCVGLRGREWQGIVLPYE